MLRATYIAWRPAIGVRFRAPVVAPLQPTVEKARLSALRDALAFGVRDAKRTRSAVEVAGTPIVESTEDHPDEGARYLPVERQCRNPECEVVFRTADNRQFKNLGFRRLDGTDVWFLTLHVPRGWRVGYMLVENAEQRGYPKGGAWMAAVRRDPLNRFHTEQDAATPAFDRLYSIFETPGAPPEPWLRRHPGVAAGAVTTRRLTSARLGTERTVDVYVPARYGAEGERPAGTVYLFDGDDYLRDMRIAEVLDNLIGERRIAPLVAVMIGDLPGAARERELSCDPNFTEFLAAELVPWVRRNYSVSLDPRRTIVGGYSMGGLEAAYAARVHPELFGLYFRSPDPFGGGPHRLWLQTFRNLGS